MVAACQVEGIVIRWARKVQDHRDQLGEQLQAARECRGLCLDDVYFKTRIPLTVLVALEANDFSVFSSPTYAKSFLRQYSDYLNVDATEWLNALEPAAFCVDEVINPVWESPKPLHGPREQSRESSQGWPAALGVVAISGGLLYGATKGYQYLEQRFGAETQVPRTAVEEEKNVSNQPTIPDELANRAVVAKPMQNDEAIQAPPRAIIVR